MFGATSSSSSSGFGGFGGFGASSSSSSGGFGGFGGFGATSSSSSASGFGGFGGFGATSSSSSSGFGGFGGFGASSSSSSGFGGFGGLGGGFGASSSSASTTAQASVAGQLLQSLSRAYSPDKKNSACHFRKMFYNVVVENDVSRCLENLKQVYPGVHPAMWVQAMNANPDVKRLCPVPVSSFSELHSRVEAQSTRAEAYKKALDNMEERMKQCSNARTGRTMEKMQTLKKNHLVLHQRVLAAMVKVASKSSVGTPITPQDREILSRVSKIQFELEQPNAYQGKLNELAPRLAARKEHTTLPGVYGHLDQSTTKDIQTFLEEEKAWLKAVSNLLAKDVRNVKKALSTLTPDEMEWTSNGHR